MKQRSNSPAKKKAATPKVRTNIVSDIIAEMKKVTWLSRRELLYLTGLVLLVTVIMALLLGVLDFGFTKLVNDVFIGGG
jgi:preprotein translocase subunit SecE